MTNTEIIENLGQMLLEKGKIKGIEFEGMIVPERLNTYQVWKSLGYQVKKGEKAVGQTMIWKNVKKKDEEGKEITKMFMTKASFFVISQVEKI